MQQRAQALRRSGPRTEERLQGSCPRSAPPGAWRRREEQNIVIGASTQSPLAWILVPFLVTWTSSTVGVLYGRQLLAMDFDLRSSLLGLPFLAGAIALDAVAAMAAMGRVEFSIGNSSHILWAVGPLGWKRRFHWPDVEAISEDHIGGSPRRQSYLIQLDGPKRLRAGSMFSKARRDFVLNAPGESWGTRDLEEGLVRDLRGASGGPHWTRTSNLHAVNMALYQLS